MPTVHDQRDTPKRPVVAASAPTELYALVSLLGFAVLEDRIRSPAITEVIQAHPGLAERFSRLYFGRGDPMVHQHGCTCWEASEIFLLASRSGTLFDTEGLDRFFDRVDTVATQPLEPDFAMPTEAPAIEAMVRERLDRLRTDPAWRAEWLQAYRALWDTVRDIWDQVGRQSALADEARFKSRLEHGETWPDLLSADHIAVTGDMRRIAETALDHDELIITPLYFAGHMKHILAFPGLVSVGIGHESAFDLDLIRERAAGSAALFKALSDPTRATILALLARREHTITELTEILGVSQPTVSNHVRQLRDAGLLDAEAEGRLSRYRISRERLREDVGGALERLLAFD